MVLLLVGRLRAPQSGWSGRLLATYFENELSSYMSRHEREVIVDWILLDCLTVGAAPSD